MSIFKRKSRENEKALNASGGVVEALRNEGWTAIPMLGGGARDRIQTIYNTAQSANYSWIYEHSPAVRTVVDVIVRNIGQLDLRLYEEVDETDRQPRPDHPAALSLRYPSANTTADGLLRGLFLDYLIHDNAYAFLTPGANGRITIIRIPAYMVQVQSESLFAVDNYRVWTQGAWTNNGNWGGAGRWVDIAPAQMLHWHGESPTDPRMGYSHLDTLRGIVAEDAAMQQANLELAQAGSQEPSWVFRPLDAPSWSNPARDKFEEDLTSRLRSRNRRPVVLEEGMEMRSFGMTPRDAQVLELRKWVLSQVASEYGVPLGMVGLDAQVDMAQKQFYADVLPPYCEQFTRMLNHRILVDEYGWTDGCFELNLEEKFINADDRLRTLVSATGRAVYLTNEARAKLNLPAVDGGDELVTPANVMVGDNPKPSVDIMGPQDPNLPPQDGSYRTDQGQTPAAPVTPGKSVSMLHPDPGYDREGATPQLHPRRLADINRQRRHVDSTKAVVQRHYNRLERAMRHKAYEGRKASEQDWRRWDREFAQDLDKVLRTVVAAEGALYAMQLGGVDFDTRAVEHYLQAKAESAAGAINDTIRAEADELGLDGAMAHAAQHVFSAGTSLGVGVTTWARDEAAQQAPGYENRVKTWIADQDRHAEWDGVTVAVGEDWPSGFAPGTVPGCSCSMSIS